MLLSSNRVTHWHGAIAITPVTPSVIATAICMGAATSEYRYQIVLMFLGSDPCVCNNWRLRQKFPPPFVGGPRQGCEVELCTPRAGARVATSPQALLHTTAPLQPAAPTRLPPRIPIKLVTHSSPWPTSTGGPSTLTRWTRTAPPTSTLALSHLLSSPYLPPMSRTPPSKYGSC